MPHYKDSENNIYWLDSEEEESFLPDECTKISDEKAKQIIDPKNALTYQQKRAMEYPPITDYLDAIVKDDKEAIQTYIEACQAVKLKYPKE